MSKTRVMWVRGGKLFDYEPAGRSEHGLFTPLPDGVEPPPGFEEGVKVGRRSVNPHMLLDLKTCDGSIALLGGHWRFGCTDGTQQRCDMWEPIPTEEPDVVEAWRAVRHGGASGYHDRTKAGDALAARVRELEAEVEAYKKGKRARCPRTGWWVNEFSDKYPHHCPACDGYHAVSTESLA